MLLLLMMTIVYVWRFVLSFLKRVHPRHIKESMKGDLPRSDLANYPTRSIMYTHTRTRICKL